jgi:hypothetical protein
MFTEGFDTPDLKEAKALLDELLDPVVSMARGLARMTASGQPDEPPAYRGVSL